MRCDIILLGVPTTEIEDSLFSKLWAPHFQEQYERMKIFDSAMRVSRLREAVREVVGQPTSEPTNAHSWPSVRRP